MKTLVFCLSMLLLLSCGSKMEEESIDFMEAQPAGSKNMDKFGKAYRGNYFNRYDSSFLEITSDKVIRTYVLQFKESKYDMDTIYELGNCTDPERISKLSQKGIFGRTEGDTIIGTYKEKDTIFTISDENVLRFYKSSYFLNYKRGQDRWKLQRLDLYKKTLSSSFILPNDSLFYTAPVKEVKELKDDSGKVYNYQIKPTKKELKNLIKAKAFTEDEVWVKIK